MEKVHCICKMRELNEALSQLEGQLVDAVGITLHESFILCCVDNDKLTPSEIATLTGLKASHTSKLIASAEKRHLLKRHIGREDKRQYKISLTNEGKALLEDLKALQLDVPDALKPFFR
jgi:DNA-binding MarR family transcriptional regulator